MRLTTKGRFAVTAMIDVNRYQQNGPVPLAGISERQDISVAYLEQLFSKLRRGNLVKSIRGPGGGYDEPLDVTRCGGSGNCAKGSIKCVTHNLWASLNERIIDYLESVTLSDLSGKETGTARDKQNSGKIALYAKPAKQKDMTA